LKLEVQKMSEDIWATVIVASVSIIGIVIAQVLSSRSSKESFVFQTRASFFQEAYRDTYTVLTCLDTIVKGESNKEKVERIQKLVDEHSYSFPPCFLQTWSQSKGELLDGEVKDLEQVSEDA
jgi:hypothetical protein